MVLDLPTIIQGGMGVAVSSWQLANAVAREGQLGVVSGTGIGIVMIARLMKGDKDGSVRRALAHFPIREVAERIEKKYYIEGGMAEGAGYKRPPMWTTKPSRELNEMTVVANFVEVWLAKQGHNGTVGINLLEKVQMPNLSSLYGAILAGVDVVIMGAGIPLQIPGSLDLLAEHKAASYRLDVLGALETDDIRIHFDPEEVFPGIGAQLGPLKRPIFLPIISSVVLAQALLKRANGRIDGFVIETPIAGGHNAPPRGALKMNERGEPVYGEKDVVNLEKMREIGLPFWLAGGYGSPEMYRAALAEGAQGIQVGTAFAYCAESGFEPTLRAKVLEQVRREEAEVRTDPVASPTGFPFKVVQVPGTVSDPEVYAARGRICDIGYLRHLYRREDGKIGYRCPSEPVDQYVKKGGKEEDTVGRTCLCNHLGAAAGLPQARSDGSIEPAIITSGDDLVNIGRFFKNGSNVYHAADVIHAILNA